MIESGSSLSGLVQQVDLSLSMAAGGSLSCQLLHFLPAALPAYGFEVQRHREVRAQAEPRQQHGCEAI